jgi:hypothetical protein
VRRWPFGVPLCTHDDPREMATLGRLQEEGSVAQVIDSVAGCARSC